MAICECVYNYHYLELTNIAVRDKVFCTISNSNNEELNHIFGTDSVFE